MNLTKHKLEKMYKRLYSRGYQSLILLLNSERTKGSPLTPGAHGHIRVTGIFAVVFHNKQQR
jgi:hypothetical protein